MALYRYPNDRTDRAGAIPVYIVGTPPTTDRPPNEQNNPFGAIPVNIVAVGSSPNSGPIPIRIVAGPGQPVDGKWPSNQVDNRAAIPVFNSPIGMPVWDAT